MMGLATSVRTGMGTMVRSLRHEWQTNGLRALLKPAVVLAVLVLAYLCESEVGGS